MNTRCHHHAGNSAGRFVLLFSLCLLLLALGACAKGGSKGGEPASPNEKKLAYGLSMNVPGGWTVGKSIAPEAASKDALDARRKNGEDIVLAEIGGPAGPRGLPPVIAVILINEEGAFIPREYAEKLKPEEFEAMSRDIMKREKDMAKKKKAKSDLLDVQVSRDSLGGNLALTQRLTVVGPDGKPIRMVGWDVYLPNGAGLAIRCTFDQDVPGAEAQVVSIVKSLRTQ